MEEQKQEVSGGGLSIASLVLGIISFFVGMFVLSGVGLLLGSLEKKKTGLTIFAIILNIASLIFDVIILASYV